MNKYDANEARVAEQMEGMDAVPEGDYDVIAIQELRSKLGVSDDYEFDVLTIDAGLADYRRHCGWAGSADHLFFLLDECTGLVHQAKVFETFAWNISADRSFYRSANDEPLVVSFANPLSFKPAGWHTVNQLGTPTGGDKVLIVGDDEHILQDVESSAISLIAPGTYKLSRIKKPNTDWDESYWY